MPPRRIPHAPTRRSFAARSLRRGSAVLLAAATAAATIAAPVSAQEQPRADKIGPHGRALLERYQAEARDAPSLRRTPTVTLMLATSADSAAEVAADLEADGIGVRAVHDEIGYLKIESGFGDVERVEAHGGVVAIDVDELIPVPPAAPAADPGEAGTPEAPGAGTPDANPYLPAHETGAVEFRGDHPEADGRGVRIGVIDTGVDLDHPALQETTTGDPKIVDWVNATDPEDPIDLANDDFFVLMEDVSGPVFEAEGRTWTAPDGGEWRFGLFHLAVAGADEEEWGVLYRPSDGTILVDLEQNGDFADETPIEDFGETGEYPRFGANDPDTEINEARAFVASGLDAHGGMVHIGVDHHGHGTHVAGIAAGHGLFGGEMNGAAPGAEIVSMRACYSASCSATALIDGMADLALRHDADVINMSIGSLPALNDGHSARALLYDRLIEVTGVQMFISAGNSGPGLNTVGDPSVAGNVISVGASVSSETWWANYGADVDRERGVFSFSSRGPREDGGFKPDLLAPGAAVSSYLTHLPGAPVEQAGYDLPPGYAMLNGTSMAAPQAAGGAALLLSAARSEGRSVPPERLRAALASTTRFDDGLTAAQQGHGHLDVPAAWELLERGPSASGLSVSAPVCTAQSDGLVHPGSGHGLYNRCPADDGGQAPGETAEYELTVERDGGPARPLLYRVGITGDEEAFQAPSHLRIGPDGSAELPVTATAQEGLNSAILHLDDPFTPGADHTVMLTVVAAQPPEFGQTPSYAGALGRAQAESRYVAVPPGTAELTVRMADVEPDAMLRWTAYTPLGPDAEDPEAGTCYTVPPAEEPCDPFTRTYSDPEPGVWDLAVEAHARSGPVESTYELEVELTPAP